MVSIAAAGARLALAHTTGLDAAPMHCMGVVLPRVSRASPSAGTGTSAIKRLRVEVDMRGGVTICDEEDGGRG